MQTSFQVGGAIVLAVIAGIVATRATGSPGEIVDGHRDALVVVVAISAVGLAGLVAGSRTRVAVQAETAS